MTLDEDDRPLGGYAALMGVFGIALAGSLGAAVAAGRPIPERVEPVDIVLVGVATHKLSRLLGKAKVTSVLRSPFTEFQEASGHGEVEERARGRGLRKSIGELVLCPVCLDQWVAGAFTVGLVAAPRPTRLLAAMWAGQAIADGAQLAYVAAKQRV
jgi:hypothetical protein